MKKEWKKEPASIMRHQKFLSFVILSLLLWMPASSSAVSVTVRLVDQDDIEHTKGVIRVKVPQIILVYSGATVKMEPGERPFWSDRPSSTRRRIGTPIVEPIT